MSKKKTKLTPDIVLQGKLNSNDPDFSTICKVVERYPNRNAAVIDGLRMLARLSPKVVFDEPTDLAPSVIAQFDIVNDRLTLIIDKINFLQSAGYSPQFIQSAMELGEDIPAELADDIRAQFLANNS